MTKLLTIITISFVIFSFPAKMKAQMNLGGNVGPFDVYVSEQGGNPVPLRSGAYNATADEGRVVNVGIFNIVGPLLVDPMNFA